MMFCMIVAKVFRARAPINEELFLADSVFDPIESHVYCFGSFLLDRVISKTCGRGVVGLHGSWWLGVTEFFEGDSIGVVHLGH
jgi:hypothetical protein